MTTSKQVRACGNELTCDPEQHRHGDGFVITMPKLRSALSSVRTNSVPNDMKFGASGF